MSYFAALCLVVAALMGCGQDTVPAPPKPTQKVGNRSAGAAAYEAICARLAAAHDPHGGSGGPLEDLCRGLAPEPPHWAAPALHALHAQRPRFETAVERAFGGSAAEPLRKLLLDLLPLHDDQSLRAITQAVVQALRAVAADPRALAAWARWNAGAQKSQPTLGGGLWPSSDEPVGIILRALGAAITLQPDSVAAVQNAMLNALAQQPEATLSTLQWALQAFGLPLLQATSAPPNGAREGTLLEQLLAASGAMLQLNKTFNPSHHGAGAEGLLAALAAAPSHPVRAALTQQVQAISAVVTRLWPIGPQSAQALASLLHTHEHSILKAARAWSVPSPAQILQPNSAFHQLLQQLAQWMAQVSARPGLTQALVQAVAHSDTALLPYELAQEMRHVDAIDFNPYDVNGPLVGDWQTPTGPKKCESTFYRLLKLVHAVRGNRLCSASFEEPMPEYAPCALFEVPDAAIFYINTLAGKGELTLRISEDDFFFPDQLQGAQLDAPGKSEMEALTGIDGFTKLEPASSLPEARNHLTFAVEPRAASRLLFALHDERVPMDSPFGISRASVQEVSPRIYTKQGEPFDEAFVGTVFAWELGHFAQAVRPLAQAFVYCDAQDLLLDLLGILEQRWPALLAEDSNFERRLSARLADDALVQPVWTLWAATAALPASGPGKLMAQWLDAWAAPEPSGASPLQQAAAALPQAILALPGVPLFDGLETWVQVLAAWLGQAAPPWPQEPVDLMAYWRAPVVQPLAKLLHTAHAQPGAAAAAQEWAWHGCTEGRGAWAATLAQAMAMAPSLPELAPWVTALGRHAFGPQGPVALAVPVLGRLLSPSALDAGPTFGLLLHRLWASPKRDLALWEQGAPEPPARALGHVFVQLLRAEPGSSQPLNEADLAAILLAAAQFMDDSAHGLMRFFDLVAQREQL